MMAILWGFLQIIIGVIFIWVGAFELMTAMVPHDIGMAFSKAHGTWVREHIFNLPPVKPPQ